METQMYKLRTYIHRRRVRLLLNGRLLAVWKERK
jgi:hypothetical protein